MPVRIISLPRVVAFEWQFMQRGCRNTGTKAVNSAPSSLDVVGAPLVPPQLRDAKARL